MLHNVGKSVFFPFSSFAIEKGQIIKNKNLRNTKLLMYVYWLGL